MLKRYVHGVGSDDPLVSFEGSGTTSPSYLLADERGSIIAETKSAGTVTTKHQYGPYGEPINQSASRFRYTGQILLPGTALYHYKARVYHPKLGRFLQTDPIGYKDGMNWYAYVGNDPMNKVDPDGTCGLFRGKLMGRGCTYVVAEGAYAKPHALQASKNPVGNVNPSSGLGARKVKGASANHKGTDYAVSIGTPVSATADGKVVFAGQHPQFGNHILIGHKSLSGALIYTRYAHGSKINISQGNEVQLGENIMFSGNSGRSTGPHLHYEVIKSSGNPTENGHFTSDRTYHRPDELEGLLNDI